MAFSLENPYHEHKQRKPGVAGLVGDFFGEGAKAALEGQIGKEKKKTVEPPREDWEGGDVTMSEEERQRVKAEVERNKPWTREQYIEWAEEFGNSEEWVDKTFEFQLDGTTVVNGDLDLLDHDLSRFPRGVVEVLGSLNIGVNDLGSLEGFPSSVRGDLLIFSNLLTSLKGLPQTIGGSLFINDNAISSLDGLASSTIGVSLFIGNNPLNSLEGLPSTIPGDLDLHGTPATSIPAGLHIGGQVCLFRSQITLAKDAEQKGYTVALQS